MNNLALAVQFFLQLAVILVFCRMVGLIAVKFGQPQVVAEMIAGVLLGPSLFGLILPEAQAWLFPWDKTQKLRDTQSYLFPASQLGLALYMFIVGMEFRMDIIKQRLKSSLAVSLAGMAAPFALGALLAWLVYDRPGLGLFPASVPLTSAMIFMGACMCITAFPMLARIIHFKGLAGTTMGTVAIGAGAIDDAMAWILLAVVLAKLNGDWSQAVLNIGVKGPGCIAVLIPVGLEALKPGHALGGPPVKVRSGQGIHGKGGPVGCQQQAYGNPGSPPAPQGRGKQERIAKPDLGQGVLKSPIRQGPSDGPERHPQEHQEERTP